MPTILVKLDEPAWPDLAHFRGEVVHLGGDAPPIELAVLMGGMVSGAASIALRLELPDGRIVIAETSAAVFLMAAAAVQGFIDRHTQRVTEGKQT